MGQAQLTTARLRLVPLSDEHLEHEVELDADPEVMRYLAHWGSWAGFTDGDFVGWWLLRTRSRAPGDSEIELGYRLLRRFWRRGLAREGGRDSSATPSRT